MFHSYVGKLSLDFRSNIIAQLHADKVCDSRFYVGKGVSECIGNNTQWL